MYTRKIQAHSQKIQCENFFVDFWVLFHLKQGGSDAIVEV